MANYFKALYGLYVPEQSKGQGMVEYGLILVLISIVAIAALELVGGGVESALDEVGAALGVGGGGTGGS